MEEIWKEFKVFKCDGPIHKTGDVLYVSNLGNVKLNDKIVEQYLHFNYLAVKGVEWVHRAVAKLFVPNPDNKVYVDHIDGNRFNNRADNLRWVTRKENNNNPITRKRISESKLGSVLTEEHKQNISNYYKKHHPYDKQKLKEYWIKKREEY